MRNVLGRDGRESVGKELSCLYSDVSRLKDHIVVKRTMTYLYTVSRIPIFVSSPGQKSSDEKKAVCFNLQT